MINNTPTIQSHNYPHPCTRLIKPVEKVVKTQIHNQGRYQQQVEHPTKGKRFDKRI